jgi:hypothetical protein
MSNDCPVCYRWPRKVGCVRRGIVVCERCFKHATSVDVDQAIKKLWQKHQQENNWPFEVKP